MSIIVAMDGPAGSGKGTITKMIEKELGLFNLDTGAMYRCVALLAIRNNINITDEISILNLIKDIKIEILKDKKNNTDIFLLNGEDVSNEIREKEVTAIVSQVSSIIPLREKMVEMQRNIAKNKNVIVEGRDISTVVFPNADLKIYLDANVEIRAKRRYKEMLDKGMKMSYEEILENINLRDYNDKNKKVGALKIAPDAIIIDTSNLTINEVFDKIKLLIKEIF